MHGIDQHRSCECFYSYLTPRKGYLSFILHAENCCVFKTHSVLGSLPRKVHFPFPIQPHGLSSATQREQVFSVSERRLQQQSERRLPEGTSVTDHRLWDPVLWRTLFSQQICHGLAALRGAEVGFYSLHSETQHLEAKLPVRCPVIHICFDECLCFGFLCVFSYWSADFGTVCQMTHWVCCVWF